MAAIFATIANRATIVANVHTVPIAAKTVRMIIATIAIGVLTIANASTVPVAAKTIRCITAIAKIATIVPIVVVVIVATTAARIASLALAIGARIVAVENAGLTRTGWTMRSTARVPISTLS